MKKQYLRGYTNTKNQSNIYRQITHDKTVIQKEMRKNDG